MTTEEAKQILHAFHPNGEDDADPFFAEALELALNDNKLGEWFVEQCAFDASMSRALQSETPPADLRAAILAQNMASPESNPKSIKKISNALILWAAIAAIIMIFTGMALFMRGSAEEVTPMTVASFTRQALDIKEQGKISLGMMSTDPKQLRTWLAARGAPAGFVIPPGLRGLPSLGCQSYTMGGTKVSLVCFTLGSHQIAHLFIVDKSALADASIRSRPELRNENGLAFATWTSGDKSYVLTGDNVSMETLKRLV
jgi:hypothetical protein